MTAHKQHVHRILSAVAAGKPLTQRMLARDLGIALGLANLLVRRLIEAGWIEVRRDGGRDCRYAITSSGLQERARLEAARLEETMSLFAETRDRLRNGLRQLAADWPVLRGSRSNGGKRVVLYGLGEMAQIAYLALRETDLQLVGFVDDGGAGTFLGLPVHPLERLSSTHLDGQPFDRLVVVSAHSEDTIRARLAARGLGGSPVYFLGAMADA